MKIKILNNLSYQIFPETADMVDIPDEILLEIGKTKQFAENGNIIPYENKEVALNNKLARLEELTKDFAQIQAGLIIENIEERYAEFRTLLNEVRVLQGKEPRNFQ